MTAPGGLPRSSDGIPMCSCYGRTVVCDQPLPCPGVAVDALERALVEAMAVPLDPDEPAAGCFPGPRLMPLDDSEPDALYPSPILPAPLTPGEWLLAFALAWPWIASATGWVLAIGATQALRRVTRRG